MTTARMKSGSQGARRWASSATVVAATVALSHLLAPQELAATQFKEVRMIIEFNDSARDVGIQFFLDSDGWQTVEILAPNGTQIFSATAKGRLLHQGGGTELFVESVEPELSELPLSVFFQRFPEGRYRFQGTTPKGLPLTGAHDFTHQIPAGPEIVLPGPGEECATGVPIPAVVSWLPVKTTIDGAPVDIVGYQVIVEREGLHFDIQLPATATRVTVPKQFLEPGADYIFEVLAIEESGNQTITEGCFTTAN